MNFGQTLLTKGRVLARLFRISLAGAQKSIQVLGELGALFGRKTFVIEKLCVILDAAAFAGSDTAHGVIISEWLRTRFRLIWRLA
jgi:hypothetical protein